MQVYQTPHRNLTKKQVFTMFKYAYPITSDVAANRENWNIYTDSLCKREQISQRQYETWTYPNVKGF